jgi:glutathione S-transferase
MGRGEETIAKRGDSESTIKLYSTWYCPFAQRAWIALEHKNIDFKFIDCILYEGTPASKRALSIAEKQERTPGFIECSPRGLVPGLQHGDTIRLHDSLPVVEYIDECFKDEPLLPADPAERARIRIGISLWNEIIVKKFYSVLMSSSDQWEKEKEALAVSFEDMQKLFSDESPFFSSFGFSMFECACLPWFQRLYTVLKYYRDFSLPSDKFKRLHDWYAACVEIPICQHFSR